MTLDKQVWLVPNENVLAVLPEERDSVVLRRLDVQEELHKWDKDCLVLTTLPPRFVAVGQTFEHQFGQPIQTGKRLLQTRLGPGRHGPFGKRVAALAGQGPACGRHGHRGLHGERCRRSRGLADFYDPRRRARRAHPFASAATAPAGGESDADDGDADLSGLPAGPQARQCNGVRAGDLRQGRDRLPASGGLRPGLRGERAAGCSYSISRRWGKRLSSTSGKPRSPDRFPRATTP